MKILFLHLSDAHLRENTNLSQINTSAIIRSLAQMGEFDECVLIFSGDIVQSGGENEYKDAELHIGVVCYCLLDLRLPKVSDFDPNFPSCVRVSLLQVAEHRTITDILVTHSLHKPMSGFRVTSM